MVDLVCTRINLEHNKNVFHDTVEILLSKNETGYKVEKRFFDISHDETEKSISKYDDFKSAKNAYSKEVQKYLKRIL